MAAEWLKFNLKNRNLKDSSAKGYSRLMKAGEWKLTGDPIRFDSAGALIDGQHRLKACISAEVPFETVVIRNLDPEILRHLDHGISRSVADNLRLEGHAASATLGAAARCLHIFKFGEATIGKNKITPEEAMAMTDRHPRLGESVKITNGAFGVTGSLLAAVHYVGAFLLEEEEVANSFAAVFTSGKSSGEFDAALKWRERLIRMKEQRTVIIRKFLQAGTIHAWNLFRAKSPVKVARVPDVVAFDDLDYKRL